jgi:drug/metabolite transporter (DMT)-like permease
MQLYLGLALLSAIFMASSGVIARFSQLPAADLTFYRLGVGALCVGLWLLCTGKLGQLKQRPDRQTLQNGILLATFMLGFLQAIQTISLANAIMMVYLAPPCTALVAHYYFAERLDLRSSLMILFALLGFAMLQQFQFDVSADPAQFAGYSWAALSLLAYSAFLLCNRNPTAGTSVGQRTFYQLLFGACCVLPFLTDSRLPEGQDWLWVGLAGLFPGFLAIGCALAALAHLPNRVYGTLAYAEPAAVILAGWWLFQEHLTLLQLAGIALILCSGMLQAAFAGRPEQ